MEDLNPATTDPLFTVDTLEACGGIIPLLLIEKKCGIPVTLRGLTAHGGPAVRLALIWIGSPAWHTGILLLDQCRI